MYVLYVHVYIGVHSETRNLIYLGSLSYLYLRKINAMNCFRAAPNCFAFIDPSGRDSLGWLIHVSIRYRSKIFHRIMEWRDSTHTLNWIIRESKKESFRLFVDPFPDLRVLHHPYGMGFALRTNHSLKDPILCYR